MWQWYPYSTKWEENIGVILHSSVDVDISLLIYEDKNTDSNSLELEMSISELILTLLI